MCVDFSSFAEAASVADGVPHELLPAGTVATMLPEFEKGVSVVLLTACVVFGLDKTYKVCGILLHKARRHQEQKPLEGQGRAAYLPKQVEALRQRGATEERHGRFSRSLWRLI